MTECKIIQLQDYQQSKDLARMYSEIDRMAAEVMLWALMPSPHDTAPSEYVAPSDDCA